MGLSVPVPVGLVEGSLQAGLWEEIREWTQWVYTATIWPSVKNTALSPDFFPLESLAGGRNEKSLCTSRVDIPCRWYMSQDPHE